MPTYLLHGFRWPRDHIRIHIILNNLNDAAPEWLVAPGTTVEFLQNFIELWPDIMDNLPNLRFVEQYDPQDEVTKDQPYAYVADVVEEVKLSLDIDEVRGRGVSNEQWESMMDLRDKLAKDAKVGWYVVVCGDEERHFPTLRERAIAEEEEDDEEEDEMSAEEGQKVSSRPALKSAGSRSFVESSSKSTSRPKTPTLQQKESYTSPKPTTPSRSRTPNELRSSSSSKASPTMSRTTSRNAAAMDSRDRQRDKDTEQKRVRFDSAHPDYIPDTEANEQQRSTSIGGKFRRALGMKESKSKSNLRDEARSTTPVPPVPHRHKPRKP